MKIRVMFDLEFGEYDDHKFTTISFDKGTVNDSIRSRCLASILVLLCELLKQETGQRHGKVTESQWRETFSELVNTQSTNEKLNITGTNNLDQ